MTGLSVLPHLDSDGRTDGLHVHVAVHGDGFNGSFGKFAALHRVWWTGTPTPLPTPRASAILLTAIGARHIAPPPYSPR